MASDALDSSQSDMPSIGEHSAEVAKLSGFGDVPSGLRLPRPIEPPKPFAIALHTQCPLCGDLAAFDCKPEWSTDSTEQKRTVHFDAFATAILNTAAMSIAHLTGKPELEHDIGSAIIEIVRLFVRTIPIISGQPTIMKHPDEQPWQPLPAASPGSTKPLEQTIELPQDDEELKGFYEDAGDGETYAGDDED